MGQLTDQLLSIRSAADAAMADAAKTEEGNRAAATRLRKQMQTVKATAQTIRTGALEQAGKASATPAKKTAKPTKVQKAAAADDEP